MLSHKIHYIFRNNLGKTVFVKGSYQNFMFKNKVVVYNFYFKYEKT
jgi:hypothetical protein